MKKQLFSLLTLISTFTIFAQSPQAINYQGIYSVDGTPVLNTSISVVTNIRTATPTGTVAYSETHTVSTNGNGIFSLQIGQGTPSTGVFNSLNWGGNSHFLEVVIEGESVGTSQFLSTPYALHSTTADTAKVADSLAGNKYLNQKYFDYQNPFGTNFEPIIVPGGGSYVVPNGKVVFSGLAGYNDYYFEGETVSNISSGSGTCNQYKSRTDVTGVEHDLSTSNYTVPAGKYLVIKRAPGCSDNINASYVLPSVLCSGMELELPGFTSFNVFNEGCEIIMFDDSVCNQMPNSYLLRGYLLDK